MRPPVPRVLQKVMARLEEWAPIVDDPQLAMEMHMIRGGLLSIEQEYDDAAARRVSELHELSSLLAEGARLRGEPAFEDEVDGLPPQDLRISSLERSLDALRRQLIELQAWLEDQHDPTASGLLDRILDFEHQSASKRASTMEFW